LEYPDGDANSSAHGYYIVSCSAKYLFDAFTIGLPPPAGVVVGPPSALAAVVHAAEDHPPYAVLLASSEEARLTLVSHTVAS
jgi:hypothetical protein